MTRPRALALTLLLWALPAGLAGQASQFGVRSLGIPLLPVSAATQGTGGGFALFDPESALNPASLSGMRRAVASFGLRQYWRTSENPYGSEGGNDTAFPLIIVGGQIGNRFAFGVSASGLTDRTFSVGFAEHPVRPGSYSSASQRGNEAAITSGAIPPAARGRIRARYEVPCRGVQSAERTAIIQGGSGRRPASPVRAPRNSHLMRRVLLLLLFFLAASPARAAELTGRVRDAESGAALGFVNVQTRGLSPEIADLTRWVQEGAPWPQSPGTASVPLRKSTSKVITEADRSFWAFQPPRRVALPVVEDQSRGLVPRFCMKPVFPCMQSIPFWNAACRIIEHRL